MFGVVHLKSASLKAAPRKRRRPNSEPPPSCERTEKTAIAIAVPTRIFSVVGRLGRLVKSHARAAQQVAGKCVRALCFLTLSLVAAFFILELRLLVGVLQQVARMERTLAPASVQVRTSGQSWLGGRRRRRRRGAKGNVTIVVPPLARKHSQVRPDAFDAAVALEAAPRIKEAALGHR